MKLLDKIFGKPEEINGAGRCPTYLYRWTIAKWRGRGIYLHHFVADDWSIDLHDHPKRFISIGLWGRYVELIPDPLFATKTRTFQAPWIRSFPARHIHRIRMVRDWRIRGNQLDELQVTASPPVPDGPPTPYSKPISMGFECYLCHTSEDPHDMELLYVHRSCARAISRLSKADARNSLLPNQPEE